ncbi:molybdenum cofactor guanylyltransferase MobA [Musicola paradisiaca]|uniref:Molybdenum cofactor guanylyltransferase n=1 Tax=Musicola paradisiaca (strain Ech703) TaxID=579405 RepID=C6C6B5_MUSP7|nr:molybdenum cofactor guanylyltransferase MobA [Musicola paradisiaca]ACS87724.1 molybdopterin-guanine dinucleotide biosynthesis protein A [Musicola paradisiaca Ech703]
MITGIILAGGKSSRMGGNDKGLIELKGKPIYQYVLERLRPQVDEILINANRHLERYQQSGYPVIGDINRDFAGPLAGIFTGLKSVHSDWAVFAPCDVPALPNNLVAKLRLSVGKSPAAYATDGKRPHPTLLLIHTSQIKPLEIYLQNGDRKLMLFLNNIGAVPVDFSDQPQAFRNLNTPEDLQSWREDIHHV